MLFVCRHIKLDVIIEAVCCKKYS